MKIHEIDRRGFLRGLGAAAATAAVPGLAKAAGQVDFKSIANQIKDVFVQNLKLSGNAQPTAPGKFKFTFDKQGKLVSKEQIESCGDKQLDAAVLQSATNIPATLVDKWQANTPTVSIAFGVGDGWWKAAVPAQEKPQVQQTQPAAQATTNTPDEELSQFSVKNIRFGMSREQVQSIFPNAKSDYEAVISIGGAGFMTKFENKKLVQLMSFPKAEQIIELAETFKGAYGKPEFRQFKSRTKGGLELDNFVATWKIKDAIISMTKHIDRDTGYIGIESKGFADNKSNQSRAEKEKAAKDF